MAECSFEYWIIQFIRMGLLFPERGVFCVTDIRVLFALHNASEDVATKAFRIKPSTTFVRPLPRARIQRHNWPPTFVGSALSIRWYRLYGYFVCDLPHWSSNQQLWKVSHCGAARPWVPQRGPLTLLQLARITIRRLVGVRHFERSVNTLKQQLPPFVFRYATRSDKMLVGFETSTSIWL